MDVKFYEKNLKLPEAQKQALLRKFGRIDRLKLPVITCRLDIEIESIRSAKKARADAIILLPGKQFRARSVHFDIATAVEQSVAKILRQLKKYKDIN